MNNIEKSSVEELGPIIMDDGNIIGTAGTEIEIGEADQSQKTAFEENVKNYVCSLSSVMREKAMISINLYNKIINALKQGRGGKKAGIDVKFYAWCKTHFKLILNADVEIICSVKNGRRIAVVEDYFEILKQAHLKTGHGGRDKMRHEVAEHFYWIPSKIIDSFLTTCISCQVRKPVKAHVIPNAIISIGFMTRLQIDLIDMRTRPDGDFKWILHCRDHFTKYSWAFALPTKEAQEVAKNLVTLFYQFGPPKILQSDNGKEFTAQIIKDLKNLWSGLMILNGRPRHPQSQGLVERGNATLCDILGKFMHDRDVSQWSSCLAPTIYSMNTSLARGINHTSFELVFRQKPRVNLSIWETIIQQGIEDEDDLPASIKDQLDEALNVVNTEETPLGASQSTTQMIVHPQNGTNAVADSQIQSSVLERSPVINQVVEDDGNKQFNEESVSNLGLNELPHMTSRAKAAKVYLTRSIKQRNIHRIHLQSLREKSNVGDFVGLRIDKVDRTNTDPKILPCVIIEKDEDRVKVACVNGILDQWWPFDVLVGLSAVPDRLVNLNISELSEISMITASKLCVRGAIDGICCSCKSGCKTNQCACKKNNVFCSTKCHKSTTRCCNIEK